jgi:hypothetical protein
MSTYERALSGFQAQAQQDSFLESNNKVVSDNYKTATAQFDKLKSAPDYIGTITNVAKEGAEVAGERIAKKLINKGANFVRRKIVKGAMTSGLGNVDASTGAMIDTEIGKMDQQMLKKFAGDALQRGQTALGGKIRQAAATVMERAQEAGPNIIQRAGSAIKSSIKDIGKGTATATENVGIQMRAPAEAEDIIDVGADLARGAGAGAEVATAGADATGALVSGALDIVGAGLESTGVGAVAGVALQAIGVGLDAYTGEQLAGGAYSMVKDDLFHGHIGALQLPDLPKWLGGEGKKDIGAAPVSATKASVAAPTAALLDSTMRSHSI